MTHNLNHSVAVIIPCYNASQTLLRAVKSVMAQTFLPEKIILIDDASKDNTTQVMKDIQNEYGAEFIELAYQPKNMGVGAARNRGLSLAKNQEYAAFLDSDDSWHPQKIEIQYSFMKSNPEIMLSGHDYSEFPNTQDKTHFDTQTTRVLKLGFKLLLFKNPFVTPSFMVKSTSDIRFQDSFTYLEDHLFILEIALKYGYAYKIRLPLATLYKPIYGASGMSAQLLRMETVNQNNFLYLYQKKAIGFVLYKFVSILAYIRYLKRLLIVKLRKLK